MKVLVTGGAGYIGSHTVKKLVKKGYEVIVLDNLSKGHEEAVDKKAILIKDDLGNSEILNDIFKKDKIDCVIHFAADSLVAESMEKPSKYYTNNLVNSLNLLIIMLKNRVNNIIFSSTAAVYGNPKKMPIEEQDPCKPINPYGETKLLFEKKLLKYSELKILNFISLRYFNAAGADDGADIGEDHDPETHLIPLILKSILEEKEFKIFGDDYPTRDGTCIRDYVHVNDLADAHILAMEYLLKENKSDIFNLGCKRGYSIKEIVKVVEELTGKKVRYSITNRRKGDPPILIADSTKINKLLGWKAKYNIKETIETAWDWHRTHPWGFK